MNTVLVIDDEKATLMMFRLLLKAYGYTVFLAENGAEGIRTAEREKPQIVFTDIKMPGMDGFEVLRRLKEMNPETEVIVITGHGDMDLAVKALNMDAADFINKPIQRNALNAALSRARDRISQSADGKNDMVLRYSDDIAVLDIFGNVTFQSENMLADAHKQLCERGICKLLIHFDEKVSVNGAGFAILIQLLAECRKNSQTTAITGISDNYKTIFDMVGITRYSTIFDNEQDAVQYLKTVFA